MKNLLSTLLIISLALYATGAGKENNVSLVNKPAEQKVDVLVDGKLFTSYIYPATIKKPVLWPVVSPAGNTITRSYPLVKVAGERVDHPHHVGIWFNYGDVNGLDFWNNSDAIAPDKAKNYGTIIHQSVDKMKQGKSGAELAVSADWVDISHKKLLIEKTTFKFSATSACRIIDRVTTLKAVNGDVKFTDNKEGVYAIRVATELELPSKGAIEMTDAHGNVTKVEKPDLSKVKGDYLSSEGITGEKVWGTRGRWMQLHSELNGEKVSIVIIDHPSNPGYPTYWHARGYGLFAANTLGQKALSNGKDELNLALPNGKSVTFRYRLVVFSGELPSAKIEELARTFTSKK